MANYNKKRAAILIRTVDGKEYKYVKPTSTGNGTLVSGTYEYDATTTLIGVGEVLSITLLTGCTAVGPVNYGINLRAGGNVNTSMTLAAQDTPEKAATAIRANTFTGYTTGGTGATVTFTCNTIGAKVGANTIIAGTTGVTVVGGAVSVVTAGEDCAQAFTDYGALKTLITNGSGWLSFDIDTTNNTLNYYNSEEKETSGVVRPRKMVSIQKLAITSLEVAEFAYNTSYP